MKLIYINLCLLIFLLSLDLRADSLEDACSNLNKCVDAVSELTGKKYLYNGKLKGSLASSNNLELTKENADQLFSFLLNENGYTRVPVGENTFQIISSRDIRYTPTPKFLASYDKAPELPDNMDYVMMEYTVKNNKTKLSTEITRALRPFMSRYGRIIDVKSSGHIIFQDTARNLKRLYGLIKTVDIIPSKESLKSFKKSQDRRFEISKIEAKSCGSYKSEIKELKNKESG